MVYIRATLIATFKNNEIKKNSLIKCTIIDFYQ